MSVYSDLSAHSGPVTYRESLGLTKQKPPNTFGDLGLGEAASKRLALSKHSFTALQDHQKYSGVLGKVLSPDCHIRRLGLYILSWINQIVT